MREEQLLKPIRFRFTEPADIERYGDGWYVYDESQIVRLPVRELIELEGELGMRMTDAMNGMRDSSILGDLAGAWLAVRLADPAKAGEFDDFSPVIMLVDWELAPDEEPGKDGATLPPPEKPRRQSRGQEPSPDSPSMPATE